MAVLGKNIDLAAVSAASCQATGLLTKEDYYIFPKTSLLAYPCCEKPLFGMASPSSGLLQVQISRWSPLIPQETLQLAPSQKI